MRKFSEGMFDNEQILNDLQIGGSQIILDAGCGTGYMAKNFAARLSEKGTVYAIDNEEIAIEKLQKEVQGTKIFPVVADITNTTPFKDSFFDLIYLSAVFHIFSKRQIQPFIHEAKRILKPSGRIAIVTFKKIDIPFGPPIENKDSPEELKEKIAMIPGGYFDAGEYFYIQLFNNN